MTRHAEEMLGPGGVLITPKSESRVLELAIDKLHRALEADELNVKETVARRLIASTVHGLEELLAQVAAGYHRNPKRGVFSAGEAQYQMSDDVHEIFYTHRQDGEDYHHPFKRNEVEMWAIQRAGQRDLLLTHKAGKPLWDDFK